MLDSHATNDIAIVQFLFKLIGIEQCARGKFMRLADPKTLIQDIQMWIYMYSVVGFGGSIFAIYMYFMT